MPFALLLTAIVGIHADASIAIRSYNYAGVPAEQLVSARGAANEIFARAGISVKWIDCRVPGSEAGATCTDQLHEGREFVLRLLEGPADSSRRVALGSSMLDRAAGRGALITIDPRLVGNIAAGASTDSATLLGRAMAHELGHLLLGRAEHTRFGLMRAFWSQDELRGLRRADWRFSPVEASQMRQGLMARARAAN